MSHILYHCINIPKYFQTSARHRNTASCGTEGSRLQTGALQSDSRKEGFGRLPLTPKGIRGVHSVSGQNCVLLPGSTREPQSDARLRAPLQPCLPRALSPLPRCHPGSSEARRPSRGPRDLAGFRSTHRSLAERVWRGW